jgi:hypothetical protein
MRSTEGRRWECRERVATLKHAQRQQSLGPIYASEAGNSQGYKTVAVLEKEKAENPRPDSTERFS